MFTLDQVVPWGRSFEEYQRMFALTEATYDEVLDGPALAVSIESVPYEFQRGGNQMMRIRRRNSVT